MARQTLGLTLTEFDALTPKELSVELDVLKQRKKEERESERVKLDFFDNHFAVLEMLINNANFKSSKSVGDFKLMHLDGEGGDIQTDITDEMRDLDAQISARAQEYLRQRAQKIGV